MTDIIDECDRIQKFRHGLCFFDVLEKRIKQLKHGLFVVFEGIDGCGKSTQSKLLYDKLKSLFSNNNSLQNIYLTSEPFIETDLGKTIRLLLKEIKSNSFIDALLFTANRMEHINQISSYLSKNEIIICDRYLDSTLNYQEIDHFFGKQSSLIDRNNFREWLLDLNKFIIFPDLVFILDMDIEQCLTNLNAINKQKEKFENKSFLTQLFFAYENNLGFEQLKIKNQKIGISMRCKTKYNRINCNSKTIEEIHHEILDKLLDYLGENQNDESK